MRINQHIFQGLLISIALIIGTTQIALKHFSMDSIVFYFVLILAPYFILLGSIYPDVDITKPWKIYSRSRFSVFFSFIKIIIAYPLRWLIYFPSYWVIKKILPKRYNQQVYDGHRCITHTVFGIFISSIILFLMSNLVIYLVKKASYNLELFQVSLLISLSVSLGFIIGALIHLVQDAYSGNGNSKYALMPFFPFNKIKFYGDYSSFFDMKGKDKTMTFFIFALLLLIPFSNDFIFEHTASTLTGTILMSIFYLSILVSIFSAFGIEFKMKMEIRQRTKELSSLFVKLIVGIIILNIALYIAFIDTSLAFDQKDTNTQNSLKPYCYAACENHNGLNENIKITETEKEIRCYCRDRTLQTVQKIS